MITSLCRICSEAAVCNNVLCPHIGVHLVGNRCEASECEVIKKKVSCYAIFDNIKMVCSKSFSCPNKYCSSREPHLWGEMCQVGYCKVADAEVKCLVSRPELMKSVNGERLTRRLNL